MNFGEKAGLIIPRRSHRWKMLDYVFSGFAQSTNPYVAQPYALQPPIPSHVTAVSVTATGGAEGTGTTGLFYNGAACVNCILPLSQGDRLFINGNQSNLIIGVVASDGNSGFAPTVANAKYAIRLAASAEAFERGQSLGFAPSVTTSGSPLVTLIMPAFNGTLHGPGQVTASGQLNSAANGQLTWATNIAPSHLFGFDSNYDFTYRGYPGQGPQRSTTYDIRNAAYVKLEWIE